MRSCDCDSVPWFKVLEVLLDVWNAANVLIMVCRYERVVMCTVTQSTNERTKPAFYRFFPRGEKGKANSDESVTSDHCMFDCE